jgi:hypothetical protein
MTVDLINRIQRILHMAGILVRCAQRTRGRAQCMVQLLHLPFSLSAASNEIREPTRFYRSRTNLDPCIISYKRIRMNVDYERMKHLQIRQDTDDHYQTTESHLTSFLFQSTFISESLAAHRHTHTQVLASTLYTRPLYTTIQTLFHPLSCLLID